MSHLVGVRGPHKGHKGRHIPKHEHINMHGQQASKVEKIQVLNRL